MAWRLLKVEEQRKDLVEAYLKGRRLEEMCMKSVTYVGELSVTHVTD